MSGYGRESGHAADGGVPERQGGLDQDRLEAVSSTSGACLSLPPCGEGGPAKLRRSEDRSGGGSHNGSINLWLPESELPLVSTTPASASLGRLDRAKLESDPARGRDATSAAISCSLSPRIFGRLISLCKRFQFLADRLGQHRARSCGSAPLARPNGVSAAPPPFLPPVWRSTAGWRQTRSFFVDQIPGPLVRHLHGAARRRDRTAGLDLLQQDYFSRPDPVLGIETIRRLMDGNDLAAAFGIG